MMKKYLILILTLTGNLLNNQLWGARTTRSSSHAEDRLVYYPHLALKPFRLLDNDYAYLTEYLKAKKITHKLLRWSDAISKDSKIILISDEFYLFFIDIKAKNSTEAAINTLRQFRNSVIITKSRSKEFWIHRWSSKDEKILSAKLPIRQPSSFSDTASTSSSCTHSTAASCLSQAGSDSGE